MTKKIWVWMFTALYGSCAMAMTLNSTAFTDGTRIPDIYSCAGKDIAPDLAWSAAPTGTKSFVLIMEDPDALAGTWTHWVLFNIPANTNELVAGKPMPAGTVTGSNSWNRIKYNGPCPPFNQTHHYQFKLYALDTLLTLKAGASAKEVKSAADPHILEQVKLTGLYSR